MSCHAHTAFLANMNQVHIHSNVLVLCWVACTLIHCLMSCTQYMTTFKIVLWFSLQNVVRLPARQRHCPLDIEEYRRGYPVSFASLSYIFFSLSVSLHFIPPTCFPLSLLLSFFSSSLPLSLSSSHFYSCFVTLRQ